jgi:hypothetical protein
MIIGYRKAAEAIGTTPYAIHTAMKGSTKEEIEASEYAPERIPGRGPQGWNWSWRDADHVRDWYESFRPEVKPKANKVAKSTKTKGSKVKGQIVGMKQASSALGVSENTIRRAFLLAREKGMALPDTKTVRGGEAFMWESKKELKDWFEQARGKGESWAPPAASGTIIGEREAASVLGVTQRVLKKQLDALESSPELLPKRASVTGPNNKPVSTFCWHSEEELRLWWNTVTSEDHTSPKALDLQEPQVLLTEDQMIERLLDEGTADALRELRDRLDTPEVRSIRMARGEEPDMPLKEMLVLVVSLGIGQWPE